MRKVLLTIFWIANLGNVIQLLVIATACWILLSSDHSFFDLNLHVFITQYVPWLLWIRTIAIELLGNFGFWILTIPILVIAPLKFIVGTIVGLWAYSAARKRPAESGLA